MKFELEKLGLIDHAEIELADLTLICGENNTGKTYVTWAIYGFLRSWRNLLKLILSGQLERIAKKGSYKFNLGEMFSGKISASLESLSKEYVQILPRVFAANDDFFSKTKIKFSIIKEKDFLEKTFQRTIKEGPGGKVLATLTKESGSYTLEVLVADDELVGIPFGGLSDFIADAVAEIVFSPHLPQAFIASAERTGSAIFRKDLDFARTRMYQKLGTVDAKELRRNPFLLLESMDAGYAWPVQDNVDFVRQLEDIDKQRGELAKEHPELIRAFETIVGGTYKVIKDKGLFYQPKGVKKLRLSMTESSSCVRAVLDIGFYLRCRAKAGDLLIIDEPELNLHPKNQRSLARLIALMVNYGVKVFITTHSDYFVKELNTLIMLAQKTPHTITVQKRYGYVDEELINPGKVRLYTTCTEMILRPGKGKREKIYTLKQAEIYPDRGIEVGSFDTTIEEMNEIQGEILYGGEL
jgi:AAA15 family ATPase/GTPase